MAMVVVFHCCGYILRRNIARYKQPRKRVSSAVQWVSTALERPLGPVALYGLILAITCWIWLSDMGWHLKTGEGYLSMGSCCEQAPCEGKKDLNNKVLFWLLSVTC